MNGSDKLIYEAILKVDDKVSIVEKEIVAISTKQEERHEENKKYLKKIDALPCDTRMEQAKGMAKEIKRLWACFWFILAAFMGAFITQIITGG